MHFTNLALVLSADAADFSQINWGINRRQSVKSTDKLVRCIIPLNFSKFMQQKKARKTQSKKKVTISKSKVASKAVTVKERVKEYLARVDANNKH